MSWRKSRIDDRGVSTTTCVVAVAICSERGVRRGGIRLICTTLQTPIKRASTRLAATHGHRRHNMRICRPSFTCPTNVARGRVVAGGPSGPRVLRQ